MEMAPADISALQLLGEHLDALAIAALARDRRSTAMAMARVRSAADRACDAAAAAGVAQLRTSIAGVVEPLLSLVACVAGRLVGLHASTLDHAGALATAHLVGLEGSSANLYKTRWRSLHVARSALDDANLQGSMFDRAVLEQCDLTDANLSETTWHRATVKGCILVGARLENATLDDARFEDCDLRRADLSGVAEKPASIWRTTFVRCDLRETGWRSRHLRGVKLIDCKLFGISGDIEHEGIEISGADVSVAGDGSEPATPGDVLRCWKS